ncbi:PAS domain-containing protein [Marinobacter sp. BW6]|uniref:PAS domain-containing protein n=1 Tax=Marinobacter sp. BW6 TaxID=2592624 RepID=UPI001396AC19|nr:PAS domain-containing protein [Marinobacter sp. BW6]
MADNYKHLHARSHEQLRRSARDLIDHGVPPPNHGGSLSVDALHLLYERASTPESAADALKLLHELQTYQVELDLLYEQLRANELETVEELTHYKSLYELAPAAYLIMAKDGEIIEGNQAAGILFDQPTTDLSGQTLSSLLAPGQEVAIEMLINRLEGPSVTAGSVELPDQRRLAINARPSNTGDSILMVLTEASTGS